MSEINFAHYVTRQVMLHPAFSPQDAGKLCYQAAYGAEHLVMDEDQARQRFFEEFDAVEARDIPLYEAISKDYARVNLAAWKHQGRDAEDLFSLFLRTASTPRLDAANNLEELIADIAALCWQDSLPFDEVAWQYFVMDWQMKGFPPVRHSQQYRDKEQPAYRVVSRALLQEFGMADSP